MSKKDKALEYFDYLVKMNPNKHVELRFFVRVYDDNCVEASYQPFILEKECVFLMLSMFLLLALDLKHI